ncbi:MAG: 50S ribosomal protein L6 [Chloroflexi bacterium ADurb.Bin325]|nr:MAG: 50S ribosomal protein L6 [Chloroflexi bacterium ADurb.Bin325]
MSRIGKLPVSLPQGVSLTVGESNLVTVKGPKGQLQQRLPADINIEVAGGEVRVSRPSDAKAHKALHGLARALVDNMVTGVNHGFTRVLEVEGVGYRAGMIGQNLVIMAGYSHPVEFLPPPGIAFEVDKAGRVITVSGIDKQVVGQMAAQIRELRAPEPYKGKGIRYQGEVVRQKAGKSGKVGGKGKK